MDQAATRRIDYARSTPLPDGPVSRGYDFFFGTPNCPTTDPLCSTPSVQSADRFLGTDYLDYNAGYVTLSITYRPRLFRAVRSGL